MLNGLVNIAVNDTYRGGPSDTTTTTTATTTTTTTTTATTTTTNHNSNNDNSNNHIEWHASPGAQLLLRRTSEVGVSKPFIRYLELSLEISNEVSLMNYL